MSPLVAVLDVIYSFNNLFEYGQNKKTESGYQP